MISHIPYKEKVVRANDEPYMTKTLRKAIMKRSSLENKYYKCNSETNRRALKKQKNYCNRLYKRERMNYYSNLNSNEITDNKNFWKTMNPFFTNNCRGQDNIILGNKEENKIISDDA